MEAASLWKIGRKKDIILPLKYGFPLPSIADSGHGNI